MDERQRADYVKRRRQADNAPRARARVYGAILSAEPLMCGLCGEWIDRSLPKTDPMSATVDHIREIIDGGAPLDPLNLQPAHSVCNGRKEAERRAARAVEREPAQPSGPQVVRLRRRVASEPRPIVGGSP